MTQPDGTPTPPVPAPVEELHGTGDPPTDEIPAFEDPSAVRMRGREG